TVVDRNPCRKEHQEKELACLFTKLCGIVIPSLVDYKQIAAGTHHDKHGKRDQWRPSHSVQLVIHCKEHGKYQKLCKHEWIDYVSCELDERLELGVYRYFSVDHDITQQFQRHLYATLCPAELLAFCSVHLHRQLAIYFDTFQKEAFPTLHLGTVAQV